MDYELRILVEQGAISSQEVIKRDTIPSDALQGPTSIGEPGLRHTAQIGPNPTFVSPGAIRS
jgi:hypothetical protein